MNYEACQGINEKYISYRKRMYYPRDLKLSDEFIQAFEKEYRDQIKSGHDKNKVLDKMFKALRFHV